MATSDDLLSRMNEKLITMSKGQRKLATFISRNYDKAVFMTAAKMGEEVGVSESTVVRFATLLGYSGYPAFQKAMEAMVQDKLNSIQKIEIASGKMTRQEVLETVLRADAEKIKLTLDTLDRDAFEMAIDTILKARRIYVLGIRSCAPLASFLGFYLNLMFRDVTIVSTNNSNEIFKQLNSIDEEDSII